jgi:hypothetical protein
LSHNFCTASSLLKLSIHKSKSIFFKSHDETNSQDLFSHTISIPNVQYVQYKNFQLFNSIVKTKVSCQCINVKFFVTDLTLSNCSNHSKKRNQSTAHQSQSLFKLINKEYGFSNVSLTLFQSLTFIKGLFLSLQSLTYFCKLL